MDFLSEQTIALSQIVTDDETCRITTTADKDDKRLQQAIRDVGLLCPPVLVCLPGGQYRIITGFRRVAVLRRLGEESVLCRLVPESASRLECFKIAVADNAGQRSLNFAEQAIAVCKLSALTPDQQELMGYARDLGIAANRPLLDKLKAIGNLSSFVLDRVARDFLGFTTAYELSRMPIETAEAAAALFTELKLGKNKQQKALTWLQEIAAREHSTPAEILHENALQAVLTETDQDRGFRAGKLMNYLYQRRYPSVSAAEEAFAQKVKDLKPGEKARLYPPPGFEDTRYTLHLQFQNKEDLEHHRRLLQRIADSDLLEDDQ